MVLERRLPSGGDLLPWAATLLAFPLAGLAARAVGGPVDAVWTAVLVGAVAGLLLGAAQWLALLLGAVLLFLARFGLRNPRSV